MPATKTVLAISPRTGGKRTEPAQQAPGSPSMIVQRANAAAEEVAAKIADRAPSSRVKELSPEVVAVWPALERAINKAIAGLPPLSADTAHLHRELGVVQGRVWNAAYVARKKLVAL